MKYTIEPLEGKWLVTKVYTYLEPTYLGSYQFLWCARWRVKRGIKKDRQRMMRSKKLRDLDESREKEVYFV